MEHFLNSMTFLVSVPVLSENMYRTCNGTKEQTKSNPNSTKNHKFATIRMNNMFYNLTVPQQFISYHHRPVMRAESCEPVVLKAREDKGKRVNPP